MPLSKTHSIGLLCLISGPLSLLGQSDWKPTFQDAPVPSEIAAAIAEALPQTPIVSVQAPRKILVFSATAGFRHRSIPTGKLAIEQLGASTGAYTAVVSDDPANFEPAVLRTFDSVLLLSPTLDFFMPNAKQREQFSDAEWAYLQARHNRLVDNLVDYVADGGGLIGIHAASDACYSHEAYGDMIGGYFGGHPWTQNMNVTIVVEDPEHAIIKPVFEGMKDFRIKDEIYEFQAEPYSREKLRVLLHLDPERSDQPNREPRREDEDFAVCWVQSVGEGRVFYTSLGHREDIYTNPLMLKHFLAGIQFATGDLPADTTPSAQVNMPNLTPTGDRRTSLSIGKAFAQSTGLSSAAFLGDPPDAVHPWAVHDNNRPQPPRVEPADEVGGAPSDAVVLFDGTEASLKNWRHERPADKRKGDWIVKDGVLLPVPGSGYLATVEQLGDCQVHVEWAAPLPVKGDGQGRGNSGVFLPGGIEVQVLDNYNNPTYADGAAGAVYGVMPPAANPLRAPGEWQSYDIIYRRPIVRDGVVLDEGSMTVLVNGVVVQDSTPLDGGGGHKARKPLTQVYPERDSLRLQDHGNPVRYRNIWYRPLRPRPVDGGTEGRLSPEATTIKRAAIAADLREDASTMESLSRALRLYESLIYEAKDAPRAEADAIVAHYLSGLSGVSPQQMASQKRAIVELNRAYAYLVKHGFMPEDSEFYRTVRTIALKNEWIKK